MKTNDKNIKEFALEDFKLNPISSADSTKTGILIDDAEDDILSLNTAPQIPTDAQIVAEQPEAATETVEAEEIEDPIFKELSAPKLPELKKETRARLQMQSPTKIHFYWTFKENPFQILKRIFGSQTNYQLVVKLINQTSAREEFFPIETEGSAWFDADADSTYQAEIGFYAVNRPFVRVSFSNSIETPRKNPSPRQDYSEYFAVSADQFAEVLHVSGFEQDAFEVALAGDDLEFADSRTENAFSQITGVLHSDLDENQASEIRFVLLALASGYSPEDLRGQISPRLFAMLLEHTERLNAGNALAALRENFGVFTGETIDEEEEIFQPAVFGASLINFPRTLKRGTLPKFSPLSSLR